MTIYRHGSHICHVIKLIFINFHFFVSKSFPMKFGYNGPVVSEKNVYEFSYLNDLDLEYSCSFIYLFSYLYLQIFLSQAGIVSKNTQF